jgi:tetraacyldisaccharide 4'-kinase
VDLKQLYIKNYFYKWVEQYLFFPNIFQRLISIGLFPFTIVYCLIVAFKRSSAKAIDFGINVVSVGNLVVGGTGKTPIVIALAQKEKNPAIVLRGYGRESKGLYVVSNRGDILEDINIVGDEAMLYAKTLQNSCVIVSENRALGILKAKELSCDIVFLDDGYRHHHIKKFDILIRPKDEPTNLFCLPSGGYKETKMIYSFVPIVLKDGVDFKREITFVQQNNILKQLPKKVVLVTAISKPNRLLEYLPKNTLMISFPDHHNYTKQEIDNILEKYPEYVIITTQKDIVKLSKFDIKNIILMDLKIDIIKNIEYIF